MHRDVGTAGEQGAFEIGGEPPLALELIDWSIGPAVTLGPDHQRLDITAARRLQRVHGQRRLSEGQGAAARRQAQGRRSVAG